MTSSRSTSPKSSNEPGRRGPQEQDQKIAEHGGDDPQDRDVPLVVSGPGIRHDTERGPGETTQIAPTILAAAEHTATLQGTPAGSRGRRTGYLAE